MGLEWEWEWISEFRKRNAGLYSTLYACKYVRIAKSSRVEMYLDMSFLCRRRYVTKRCRVSLYIRKLDGDEGGSELNGVWLGRFWV